MPPLNDNYECSFECWMQQVSSPSSFSALPDQPFKPARRQRPVTRFREGATVHDVMALSDFTSEEVQSSWYEPSDYNEFRKDVAVTVYLARCEPHAIDDVKYTSRGTECRSELILARRHQWKREAKSAVLDEQADQNERGEKNEIMISAVYSHASQEAVLDAIDAAARDQFDAEAYQNESDTQDDFNDDWISSISSSSSPSYEAKSDSFQSWDESGFDDSWITDLSPLAT